MKALLSFLLIIVLYSCTGTTITPFPENVKAKLRVNDVGVENHRYSVLYNDIIIGNIDPMYKIHEHIRYFGRDCIIIEIEERPFKHIVYPGDIRSVSSNPDSSTLLECYQYSDTLELRFKHP